MIQEIYSPLYRIIYCYLNPIHLCPLVFSGKKICSLGADGGKSNICPISFGRSGPKSTCPCYRAVRNGYIHVEICQLATLFWLLLRAPAGIPGHSEKFLKSFRTRGVMFAESKSTPSLQFSSVRGQASLTGRGRGMKIHLALNDLFSVFPLLLYKYKRH